MVSAIETGKGNGDTGVSGNVCCCFKECGKDDHIDIREECEGVKKASCVLMWKQCSRQRK